MIARGRQLRCLWVYAPEVEACSALHGIMWELQRKVREFHQSAETFWLHNGSIVNRNLVEFSNWKPPMLLPWSWLKMIPLLASIISFQRAVPHILFVVVVSFMSFSKCPWFSQVRATPPISIVNDKCCSPRSILWCFFASFFHCTIALLYCLSHTWLRISLARLLKSILWVF